MNIKEAIDRVHRIDERINSIRRFVDDGNYVGAPVRLVYGTWSIDIDALFTVDEKRDLILRERARLEAELAKLASVIDMANAALKGIGA